MTSTTPSLQFEQAGQERWPEIWEIFRSVVGSGDTYPYPPDIAEDVAFDVWMRIGDERGATYVALERDVVVATAYLRENSPGLSDHIANAGWMVAPGHRGRGIGRRFADFVMDEAARLGYRGMQFNSVVATNTTAIALWESLGFEIVGTIPDAFRHAREGLTPVHVMFRAL
jgi:L-amino acid N-acyltransferase YncA